MSLDPSTPVLVIPASPRRGRRPWAIVAAIAIVSGLYWAWSAGYRPWKVRQDPAPVLATVEVDRGDVVPVVTENGSIESADNAVVRCEVESFLALPPGAAPPAPRGGPPGAQPVQGRGPRMAGSGGSTSSGAGNAAVAGPAMLPKGQGAAKAKAVGAGAVSTLAGKTAAEPSPGAAPGAGPGAAADPAAALDSSTGLKRPDIRSFDYIVEPHTPLRANSNDPGPRSGPPPQPPTILSILPEGTRVKKGDVVCDLDASAFRDELRAQQIRCAQAKAWVDQARSILEVNEIARSEYEDGVYPQDLQLIRQYILACRTSAARARQNVDWARGAGAKGFRTRAQVKGDELDLQKAEIAVREAEGMLERLVKYTGKRILTARKAKIEAIRADMLSLESSYQRERERLKRIEAMIAHCTMRAPREGVVVYANKTNPWGMVETQIREGLTVYQSQPIFQLPDPKHMRVKAKINESQIVRIRSGQPALIRVDAFPDEVLRGTVAEITPLPAPANGPVSEVRAYFATVRIDSGESDALRTGLSAEVDFQVEPRRQVTRVPLEAIRWAGGRAFAALAIAATGGPGWRWKPVALGASDETFAEVVAGLKPGDRVVAHSESLPAPAFATDAPGRATVLALEGPQGGR